MLEKDEIERWITTDSGAHIPIAKTSSEKFFVDGLEGKDANIPDNLYAYFNDGETVKKRDLSEADRNKIVSSGIYDLKENSFGDNISSLENLEIKKQFSDATGEMPKGTKITQKNLDWNDRVYSESLKAAEKYKNEMKNFESKGAKKLLYQRSKWYEKNADDAMKTKDWLKRAIR